MKYMLIFSDGYSIETTGFNSFIEANRAMQKQYCEAEPSEYIDDFGEMSYVGSDESKMYRNGEEVLIWKIVPVETGNNRIQVAVDGGMLVADASQDPDYPGIDIEFVPEDDDCDTDCPTTKPRVLVEKPKGERLRTLLWNDPYSEDYSHEIEMVNNKRGE